MDIQQLQKIKHRAQQAANPLSATILPAGLMILITSVIPLTLSVGVRLLLMVLLFSFWICLSIWIQKYYARKIGYAVPDEDMTSFLIRNSGFLIFIFVTLNLYPSFGTDYMVVKYPGIILGIFGILGFLWITLQFVNERFVKKNTLSETVLSKQGTLLLYFLVTWISFEFIFFWRGIGIIPLFWPLFAVGVFISLVALFDKTRKVYLIPGIILTLLGILVGLLFSVIVPSEVMMHLYWLQNYFTIEPLRTHWTLIGLAVLFIGIYEHRRLLNLFKENANDEQR
jgi:hypothetical protein